MNSNNPKICFFYQQGKCKYGDSCNNLHQKTGNQPNNSIYNNDGNNQFKQNLNQNQNKTIYTENVNKNFHGKHFSNNNNHGNFKNKFNTGFQNNNNSGNNMNDPTICIYFLKPGGCKNGDKCKFLHSFHKSLKYLQTLDKNSKIVGIYALCKFSIYF